VPVFQPTAFGKYFLVRRLAVGGMAEVYLAKLYGTDGFEKDLVIKQILPQYAKDPEFVQSFVAEAKIAVSLNHANMAAIYELGRVDGTYFIAMEYVDGFDLFALIDACKRHGFALTVGAALLIVEEVSKGLDYAHRKLGPDGLPLGLIHRDLNPRNVLISKAGEVKILDFGIAKIASRVAQMPKTRAGVVKGTTGYMSPEQAIGREIDPRTDIYQAGLLLFEALTGQALFWRPDDETTRELMRRHKVIPPSELVRDIPPEVDALVFATLDRDPARRPQTAAELAARIARIRYARYADVTHADVGALVTELALRESALASRRADAVPMDSVISELDFSDVISRAIEQSIVGEVETIAQAPSSVIASLSSRRPVTGSEPIAIDDAPALLPAPLLDASEAAVRTAQAALNLGAPLAAPVPRVSASSPGAAPPSPAPFGRAPGMATALTPGFIAGPSPGPVARAPSLLNEPPPARSPSDARAAAPTASTLGPSSDAPESSEAAPSVSRRELEDLEGLGDTRELGVPDGEGDDDSHRGWRRLFRWLGRDE
jgi:serine/threonine protein kinase